MSIATVTGAGATSSGGFGSAIREGTARGHGPVRPVEQTDDGPDVGSGGWGVVPALFACSGYIVKG